MVDDLQRVDDIPLGLAHLVAFFITNQAVQINIFEGDFSGIFDAHHNHAGDPEEQNIITCFQYTRGVEITEICRIFRPAQSGMRPQSGGKPGIEHVHVLFDFCRSAVRTGFRRVHGDYSLAAILTVICRDTLPPPQLAGDTPVTDIFHPVQIDLGEMVGNNLNLAVFHNFNRRFGQRFHLYKPLRAGHRLNHGRAALTVTDSVTVILDFNQ